MRPSDKKILSKIGSKLTTFMKSNKMPGIKSAAARDCLLRQIIDSIRRVEYVTRIRQLDLRSTWADPTKMSFNPLKAAIWFKNDDNLDEAFWLVFLSTHFGKHKDSKWNLLRTVYTGLKECRWTWINICSNMDEFQDWLLKNKDSIEQSGNFGNHRKYQSLKADSDNGTVAVIKSYVEWVGPKNDHMEFINRIKSDAGENSRVLFDALYKSMGQVRGFGRMGKFDYLTMLGKLGLLKIEPRSVYLAGATGPVAGARLLFGGSKDANIKISDLERVLNDLEAHLDLYFGMQVLEDAICNWQKSPFKFKHFAG